MFFDLKSYLIGKHGGAYTPSAALPSYLMGRAKSGGIQEITGTLPLAVRSRASQVLTNYIIYGESVQDGTPTPDNPVEVTGLGVRTENLFDKNSVSDFGYYLNQDGTLTTETIPKTSWVSDYISVEEGESYFLTRTGSTRGKFYKDDFTPHQTKSFDFSTSSSGSTFNIPATVKYVRFTINVSQGLNDIMLTEGSAAPTSYIPHGYKLPMTVTSGEQSSLVRGTYTDVNFNLGDFGLKKYRSVEYHLTAGHYILVFSANVYLVRKIINGVYEESNATVDKVAFDVTSEGNVGFSFRNTTDTSWDDSITVTLLTSTPIYIGDRQLMRIPDTEYADYVDYETGKIVRQVKKLVLTGDEPTQRYSKNVFFITMPQPQVPISKITFCLSNEYKYATGGLYGLMTTDMSLQAALTEASYPRYVCIHDSRFDASENFKSYLADQYAAGTPVIVWYVLNTPVEEDPPVPFPDITIPKGEVTFDIYGELKPQATVKGLIKQI